MIPFSRNPVPPNEAWRKVIETCWRCMSFGTIKNTELGLCPKCIEELRDPGFVKDFNWQGDPMMDVN